MDKPDLTYYYRVVVYYAVVVKKEARRMHASAEISLHVPARTAAEALPGRWSADGATLVVDPWPTAEAAFWGREARRFPAAWTHGPLRGRGHVEVRPFSASGSGLVISLERPRGLRGLGWSHARLAKAALGLAAAVRRELEAAAGEAAETVREAAVSVRAAAAS